jgi:hypothetical protein
LKGSQLWIEYPDLEKYKVVDKNPFLKDFTDSYHLKYNQRLRPDWNENKLQSVQKEFPSNERDVLKNNLILSNSNSPTKH